MDMDMHVNLQRLLLCRSNHFFVALLSLCIVVFLTSCDQKRTAAADNGETVEAVYDEVTKADSQAEEVAASQEETSPDSEIINTPDVPDKPYPAASQKKSVAIKKPPIPAGMSVPSSIQFPGAKNNTTAAWSGKQKPIKKPPSVVSELSEYSVVLGVDKEMEIPGFPGELRVWIGDSAIQPGLPETMTQDATTMPAVGESARVEPFATAFEIDPAESQCIRIHPSGSVVRFKLTPKKEGTFDVGADVFLFDSEDCSGSPVPKTAATLQVTVNVNNEEIIAEKTGQLGSIFWEKLLDFWTALIALLFGVLLFLIRNKIKQWFGFEEK